MAISFILRYSTEEQKEKLEAIAKHCGRSANSHILQLIEKEIDSNKKVLSKPKNNHYVNRNLQRCRNIP